MVKNPYTDQEEETDQVHRAEDDLEDDARTHRDDEHSLGHGEPWLVSYADMMTLLFGFFVILYAFEAAKNKDAEAMTKVRREISQYFGGEVSNPLENVKEELNSALGSMGVLKDVKQTLTPEGLEITFQSALLFDVGEATLAEPANRAIRVLINLIKATPGSYQIKVEGYTDDAPIRSAKYPSNWELSAARAATVVRLFEAAGFDPERLSVTGLGQSRPAVPNRDLAGAPILANQSLNRRVKLKIVRDLEEKMPSAASALPSGK